MFLTCIQSEIRLVSRCQHRTQERSNGKPVFFGMAYCHRATLKSSLTIGHATLNTIGWNPACAILRALPLVPWFWLPEATILPVAVTCGLLWLRIASAKDCGTGEARRCPYVVPAGTVVVDASRKNTCCLQFT